MYNFPIWLRKYTFKSLKEHFNPPKNENESWIKGEAVAEAKKTVKVPDYITSYSKPKPPSDK